jgi:ribosomal protein L11 methyltransferase
MSTPDARNTAPWRVLSLHVPAALEDEVASVIGGGSLGVEVAPAGAGLSAVRVYLGPADDAAAWYRRAERVLAAHGIDASGAVLGVAPVEDGRWVETWQAALRPIPLGERFVVVQRASASGLDGREVVRLVPGMAFGTGEHETTRMCAAALERCVTRGSRWIDVGTGTGILAVVAARCGAARVLAVDSDPEAAHVAGEVVDANGAGGSVEVRAGSIEARGAERFDGLVANIQASFVLGRAAEIAAALEAGGVAIFSGVLFEDLDEIEGSLSEAGFSTIERRSDGPWACLSARKGA